jgi:DNA polymerase V
MYTMGDVARCALQDEEILYKLFGINAELLIDHAFGIEPATIEEIKAYKPENNSVSSGQVLHCPYDFAGGRLIVREMTDLLVLDLVDKKLVTDQIVLTIGYDISNLTDPDIRKKYKGAITTDYLGRTIPEHAHGSANMQEFTSSTAKIMDAVMALYDRIVNKDLLVRRINVTANHLKNEKDLLQEDSYEQMDLFTDYKAVEEERAKEKKIRERERRAQEAVLAIKKKYGKNAILKGMNLEEGAQTIARNSQIGGHKA